MAEFAGLVSPGEGQGEQAEHFAQAFGVDEVGVLEVEAAGFQAAKQSFDLPATGIGLDGLGLWREGTGDDQPVAIWQTQRGQRDETAPDRTAPRQVHGVAGLKRSEEPIRTDQLVPGIGDEGVALEALMKRDARLLQPGKPVFADAFAIGQQGGDCFDTEDREKVILPSFSGHLVCE